MEMAFWVLPLGLVRILICSKKRTTQNSLILHLPERPQPASAVEHSTACPALAYRHVRLASLAGHMLRSVYLDVVLDVGIDVLDAGWFRSGFGVHRHMEYALDPLGDLLVIDKQGVSIS
jgi:hypothetical protein